MKKSKRLPGVLRRYGKTVVMNTGPGSVYGRMGMVVSSDEHPGVDPEDQADDDVLDEVLLRGFIKEIVAEVIKKCGDRWCLYTKHKGKNGKRRRLGTHSSRAGAERQERAIKRSQAFRG